ncbi:hypothetical protein WMY93_005242 [Mugilogobius chulae]|uniref:Uncharacterized protein n=1 Tax=Mugilogobius chulae TaxID=88201 RepID=A0AAW0Q1I4_9GOBI
MEKGQNQALFPWYKERLCTKYINLSTIPLPNRYKAKNSTSASSWTHGRISPVIFTNHSDHLCCCTSIQMPKQPVSKKHACFSRQMIQKQRRREYVAAVENELQQPFAQYQQYKDYMSAEQFDKVLSALCPDKSPNNNNRQDARTIPFEYIEEKDEKKSC